MDPGDDWVLFRVQVASLPVLALVNTTVLAALGPVYWHLRQRSAIRTRNPGWTLLNLTLLVVMMLNHAYDGWRRYPPCAKILFTNVVVTPIVVDVYVIRCWMLLYHWHVSRALCTLESDSVLTPEGRAFQDGFHSDLKGVASMDPWLRHMSWSGTGRLRLLLLGAALVHICIWIWLVYTWSDWEAGPATTAICTPPLVWFFGVWGLVFFMSTVAVLLAYNLRLLVDVFAIRAELMGTGLVYLLGTMPFWAVRVLMPDVERIPTLNIMLPISSNVCGTFVLWMSIMRPLLITSHELRRVVPAPSAGVSGITVSGLVSDSQNDIDGNDNDIDEEMSLEPVVAARRISLRHMLDTMTGIAGNFIRFLTKEFSIENWRYYSEVNHLRRKYGGWRARDAGRSGVECGSLDWFHDLSPAAAIELRDDLSRIFVLYLAAKAPFEINLNSTMLESIRACFDHDDRLRPERQEYLPMLLCRAQDQIYNLMKVDSYERFKRSPDFDQHQLALV